MKNFWVALLTLLLAGLLAAGPAHAKDKADSGRLLTGKVVNKQEQPLPDAVVYLSNTRTRAVKTFIVGPDGVFHFPSLSKNIDYEVSAQLNGHKSDTKTVSQFDDRAQVSIVLKIDTK